jgi:HD-like signal output (HDOD) protein
MLLKTANSALFGFKNKIDSIKNMVNLLGIDFTVSLILSNSLQSCFDIDFSPYGIDVNQFRNHTVLSVNFINIWLSLVDIEIKNKLLLPMTIMDIGKYIISNEINKMGAKDTFLSKLKTNPQNLSFLEIQYCSFSSSEVTVMLLEHWKIDKKITELIEGTSHIKQSKEFLDVAQTICNILEPLSEASIKRGLEKAINYNLDITILRKAINTMQERIEEEKNH